MRGKVLVLDVNVFARRGEGYVALEERSDVPGYRITTRGPNGYEHVQFVDAPKTNIRAACSRCAGRGRVLTSAARTFLENLAQVLRDQVLPDAAGVDAYNASARAELAARAKKHEVERERHEAADKLEREAMERVAAIRAGKVAPEVRK